MMGGFHLTRTLTTESRGYTILRPVYQDSLSSMTLVTDTSGNIVGSLASYLPFVLTRGTSVPVDEQFIGQKKDSTGLFSTMPATTIQ
jgi:hypothetical protein